METWFQKYCGKTDNDSTWSRKKITLVVTTRAGLKNITKMQFLWPDELRNLKFNIVVTYNMKILSMFNNNRKSMLKDKMYTFDLKFPELSSFTRFPSENILISNFNILIRHFMKLFSAEELEIVWKY